MASLQELRSLIRAGRESRNLEYKGAQPWRKVRSQVARTALGMANIEGGGHIIVGVDEIRGRFVPRGLSPDMLRTFRSDEIKAHVNGFADPFVELSIEHVEADGLTFVVIRVEEFAEVPVVASKAGEGIRRGALYVRSLRTTETAEVQNQTDMRTVIDLATAKGIARNLRTLARAGISLTDLVAESSEARFREEGRGL
mgnify:CR=1 FL=1